MDIKLLKEFKEESNLRKFDTNTQYKLSTGTDMGTFFRIFRKKIENSEDFVCKEIIKQYDEYLLNKKKSEDERYNMYLKQFEKMENYKKFEPDYDGKFADGKSVSCFFYKNKERILNSEDEISKKIKNSYRTYLSYSRIQDKKAKQALINIKQRNIEMTKKEHYNSDLFIKRLNLFKNIESNNKFLQTKIKCIYLDGVMTANDFWHYNKKYILNSEDEICMEIKAQYEEYERQKELSKSDKILEFRNLSFEKFSSLTDMKFEDGTNVYNWWIKNNQAIINCSDDLCQTIITQYDSYISMTDGLSPKEMYEDGTIERLNNMYL